MNADELKAMQAPLKQKYKRATLIRLTERCCVVLQTLRQPPAVSVG